MKKLLLIALFITSYVYAGQDESDFQSVSISSAGPTVRGTFVFFNYPTGGSRNCITDISVSADGLTVPGYSFYILDGHSPGGGTTSYAISSTTYPVIESWYPKNPLCLSANTTTYVYVSTGNAKINVSGYVKPR